MDQNSDNHVELPVDPSANPSGNLPSDQPTGKPKKHPKTIEELKCWYVWHHLPPEEVTRFFIGKDYQGPKAFGIYKNEQGECVVYKNKANGERAVRYQGTDEAFAVGELLQRLKDEIANQKARLAARSTALSANENAGTVSSADVDSSDNSGGIVAGLTDMVDSVVDFMGEGSKRKGCFLTSLFAVLLSALFFGLGNSVPNGYYKYSGKHYYHQGSSWYYYNPTNRNWSPTQSLGDVITHDNADQYRIGGFSGPQFEDSEWYDDGSSWYDDDDDDDSNWDDDDDSWSSDDTDWDSDW